MFTRVRSATTRLPLDRPTTNDHHISASQSWAIRPHSPSSHSLASLSCNTHHTGRFGSKDARGATAAMAPVIATSGQTRSRLPTKWMQHASVKSAAAPTTKTIDHNVASDNPIRWSSNTLAFDPNDTVRSRAESTTSTYVDTFAHRRKSRISDLTFVDPLVDDSATTQLTHSDSLSESINDLSLTLNNDDDDYEDELQHPTIKGSLTFNDIAHTTAMIDRHNQPSHADLISPSDDSDDEDDDLAERIDRLMAATMEALEASNRLVLETLSSRAKLAQIHAMEAALDSHLDAREAHLYRQIQAVNDMTDFVAKTSAELQKLTSPPGQSYRSSTTATAPSTTQVTSLAEPAELEVRGAAAQGIVQALDRDATIGKTAAKRLERMLQSPTTTPTSSPSSASAAQRRTSDSNRRAFSISNFGAVQSSIAEEDHDERTTSPATPSTPSNAAASQSSCHTSTPQKKRSVSYDSRAPGALKLMSKLSGPSRATSAGFAPSSPAITASTSTLTSSAGIPHPTRPKGPNLPATRPSLMATLRQEPASTSTHTTPSLTSETHIRQSESISGLPSYSKSASSNASLDPSTARSPQSRRLRLY